MKEQNKESSIRRKAGSYSFLSALILFFILAVVTLAVYALPTTYTIFDTTPERSLSLSKDTVDFVKDIDEDITIYYICENGEQEPTLETVLGYYKDLNSHIKVKVIDPYTNPDFIDKYLDIKLESDSDATYFNYSLVFESAKRHTFVSYDTICYYNYGGEKVGGYWEVRYTYDETQLSSLLANCDEVFDAEFNITSAMDYVTVDTLPTMYYVGTIGDKLGEMLDAYNMKYEKLDLSASAGKILENCNALLLTGLEKDISADESGAVADYLKKGGKLILCTDTESVRYKNLISLLDGFCVSPMGGQIYSESGKTSFNTTLDSKNAISSATSDSVYTAYYNANASYLSNMGITTLEQLKTAIPLSSLIGMPSFDSACGIAIEEDIPKDTEVSIIMTSPKDSYLSTDGKEKLDNEGSYAVGVSIIKSYSENAKAEIVWYSSESIFSDSKLSSNKISPYVTVSSLAYVGVDGIFVSEVGDRIEPVTRETKYLDTDVTDFYIYCAIFVLIIPIAVFVGGLVIWIKRRKR